MLINKQKTHTVLTLTWARLIFKRVADFVCFSCVDFSAKMYILCSFTISRKCAYHILMQKQV